MPGRDRKAHWQSLALDSDYLALGHRGRAAGPNGMDDLGIPLSRGFGALKTWLCFKAWGLECYAQAIAPNIAQARYPAHVNHRSRREDFDLRVAEVRRLGSELVAKGW